MKLHLDTINVANTITGHGADYVTVNGDKICHAVMVLPDTLIDPWQLQASSKSAQLLCIDDFTALIALKPELVVFGSGAVFCFPNRRIMAGFADAKIGFEVMDTPAACRTYNVLASEGRRIAAALLIG